MAAKRSSLSKLRLSPHYTALARFHAAEGPPHELKVEASAADSEDVMQICRHLDLQCEALTAAPGAQSRTLRVRRPLDEDEGPPGSGAAADGTPAGGPAEDEQLPQLPPGLERERKEAAPRPKGAAAEAEDLVAGAPAELAAFYRALVDFYPGHQAQLAKLLIKHLGGRAAGFSPPASSDSDSSSTSSDSSDSSKKKKKKKKRKAKKKAKKKAKREAKAEAKTEAKNEAKEEALEPGAKRRKCDG